MDNPFFYVFSYGDDSETSHTAFFFRKRFGMAQELRINSSRVDSWMYYHPIVKNALRNPSMIRTASTTWAAPFLSPFLPLYDPSPHILHQANPHRLGPLRFTAGLPYTHIPQQSHRLVATLSPPSLERQGGRVGKPINCEGPAVGPVLRGPSGATTIIPSMTRAAGGLVARRSDRGLSSRLSNIPVFAEFHNASTKPHIPYGRLQSLGVALTFYSFAILPIGSHSKICGNTILRVLLPPQPIKKLDL